MFETKEANKEITSEMLPFEVAGVFGEHDSRIENFVKSLRKKTIYIKKPKRNVLVLEGTNIVYVLSVNDSTFNWYRTGNCIYAEVITVRNPKTKEIIDIKIKL